MKDFLFTDLISFVGEAPKKFDGYKKYVSTGAVNGNIIESDDIELVDYSSRPSRANLVACSGDILFAKMAETEKTLLLDDETDKNIYSTGFCAVRAKESIIEPKALYYLLGSSLFLNQKNTNSSGATQRAITNTGLSKIRIKLPTMEKQRVFCGIMDKVVDSIELRKKQLGYFDKFTKSLFIEMFGDPIENPMNWDVKELGDYITVLTDFNSNGSYELLDSNVVMKDEPDYAWIVRITDLETMNEKGRKYIDEKTWNLLEKSKICGNEIIMCKIGSAGKFYIMPNTGKPASLGRNAFMFRFNELLEREYVYYLLNTDYGIKEITQYVRGAVTKTITKDDVRRLRVIVPPINEQRKFISFINKIDKSKLAVKKSLEELEILKKSLMQKYFA